MSIGHADIPLTADLFGPFAAATMDGGYMDTIAPVTPGTGSSITNVAVTTADFNFTLSPDLCDGYVVFQRAGVTTGQPTVVNSTPYVANDLDASGNWTCVTSFNFDDGGTPSEDIAHTVNLTGLLGGTAYRVVVFSYNGIAEDPVYEITVTDGENAENFTTNAPPVGLWQRRKDKRGRVIMEQTYKATGTTDASGDATIYAPTETGKFVSGRVLTIMLDADAGTLLTGSDITVTAEKTGQAILSASNIGTSDVFWKPRVQSQDTTGTAIAGIYEPITIADDRVKIVIAQGGASKTAVFYVTVG